jgi:hypothetical protein
MDPEELFKRYEAREPRYTERDYLRRFAEIKNARAISISGGPSGSAPGDRMIGLLASGRVSDAEYFRLADLMGVDSAGLIHSEPSVEDEIPTLARQLRAIWKALIRQLASLRRL